LISDDDIERAVSYLRDSARDAAQARADREYISQYLKSKMAILMNGLNEGSEAMRERSARSHPEYLKLLDGYKEAVRRDEEHRFMRAAAEAKIDAWRTFSATARGRL
jgi:hypothetical protein